MQAKQEIIDINYVVRVLNINLTYAINNIKKIVKYYACILFFIYI
jgi:hypothetical protein